MVTQNNGRILTSIEALPETWLFKTTEDHPFISFNILTVVVNFMVGETDSPGSTNRCLFCGGGNWVSSVNH